MQEIWVRSLGQENPLEKEMVTHSGILAWEIPWTEVHGVTRVRHYLATKQQQNERVPCAQILVYHPASGLDT